jgi:hypothetical protein
VEGYDTELDEKLSDVHSSIHTSVFSAGYLLGPIIGSALYDKGGYYYVMDTHMIAFSLFLVVMF